MVGSGHLLYLRFPERRRLERPAALDSRSGRQSAKANVEPKDLTTYSRVSG